MKKYFRFSILLFSLALCAGCEKLLEVNPESQITEQVYFKNESDFEPYVTGIYTLLRGPIIPTPKLTGFADNLVYGTERSEELVSALNDRFTTAWSHTLSPTVGAVDYNPWYRAIGHCNLLLSKIEPFEFTNQDNKKRITAEAYCLRAYFYFHLTRVIGDAPIMLDPVTDDNVPMLPRSNAADVMKQIFSDLDKAISLFPAQNIPSKYRFSYAAAQTLKADAKLWNAKVIEGGDPDFQDAIAALTEVEKAGLALLPNFKEVTTVRANSEVLFAAFWLRDESGSNYGMNALPYYLGIKDATNIDSIPWCQTTSNGQGAYQISPKSRALFASNDKRIPFTWVTERQGSTLKISWITKLPGTKYQDDRVSDNDLIVYRLADVYLMMAEAYAGIEDGAKAIEYLNKTRQRAGIGDYTGSTDIAAIEKEILDERGRELFFENKRWYDLVRFHKGGTIDVYTYVPNLKDKKTPLFWPLSASVLANNSQISQTDGY